MKKLVWFLSVCVAYSLQSQVNPLLVAPHKVVVDVTPALPEALTSQEYTDTGDKASVQEALPDSTIVAESMGEDLLHDVQNLMQDPELSGAQDKISRIQERLVNFSAYAIDLIQRTQNAAPLKPDAGEVERQEAIEVQKKAILAQNAVKQLARDFSAFKDAITVQDKKSRLEIVEKNLKDLIDHTQILRARS